MNMEEINKQINDMNPQTINISMEGLYTLQVPDADRTFFLSLIKKMGWTAHKAKATATIPAATIEAIVEARSHKNGVKVQTDTLDNFIQSMS